MTYAISFAISSHSPGQARPEHPLDRLKLLIIDIPDIARPPPTSKDVLAKGTPSAVMLNVVSPVPAFCTRSPSRPVKTSAGW
jgi:hypothetical protein